MEKKLGSEEGPKGLPKALKPATPEPDPPKVPPVTPENQVRMDAKTPAQVQQRPELQGNGDGPQGSVVPAVMDMPAANSQRFENGETDLQKGQDVSGQRHLVPVPMFTPGSQTSPQPLFDAQQLRRFQELYSQAPSMYGREVVWVLLNS